MELSFTSFGNSGEVRRARAYKLDSDEVCQKLENVTPVSSGLLAWDTTQPYEAQYLAATDSQSEYFFRVEYLPILHQEIRSLYSSSKSHEHDYSLSYRPYLPLGFPKVKARRQRALRDC